MSTRTPVRPPVKQRLFRGREAGKQRSRAFTLTVGFVALIIAAVMFYVGYDAPQSVPFRSYYNLHALFANADNLEDHYEIRIGSERAGQVLHPRVSNHLAEVDLQLSSAFKPLLSDSRIEIRLRSAVGVRYVNIIPGTKGTPLPEGATIPVTQTSAPVDLDQVERAFDAPTRKATSEFLGELGTGVAGQGQNINQMLGDVPGFLSSVGSVSGAINARPNAMRNFISGAQGAAAAFDPVRNQLADGFQPENQALRPFVTSASDVKSTLDAAPPALSELSSGLPPVTAFVAQVQGLATAATPTLALAPKALDQTTALLHDAQPGLHNLNATLNFAHNAVSPTLTFLQTADPVLPDVRRALNDALPIVRNVAPRACGISDAMTGWAGKMQLGTQYDNFIRFTIAETQTIVSGLPTTGPLLTNPYPAPCNGTNGEAGGARPTPEQMVAAR